MLPYSTAFGLIPHSKIYDKALAGRINDDAVWYSKDKELEQIVGKLPGNKKYYFQRVITQPIPVAAAAGLASLGINLAAHKVRNYTPRNPVRAASLEALRKRIYSEKLKYNEPWRAALLFGVTAALGRFLHPRARLEEADNINKQIQIGGPREYIMQKLRDDALSKQAEVPIALLDDAAIWTSKLINKKITQPTQPTQPITKKAAHILSKLFEK